jgi:pSer/pThr/pTyr-binding forkhead associated (FHA) protein
MPITVVVRSSSPVPTKTLGAAGDAPSLTFDGGRIVLGRSDGSDVRLPDPTVSQRHASIRAEGAEYTIVDEGSTNGTWVGGVKLGPHTPRLVKSGDLVRVGRVWVELVIGHAPPTPDLALATREVALALVRQAMDAAGDDTIAKVRVAEGPDLGAELPLREEGRIYLIGRAERCDLPLADEDASREHASVVRRGQQVFLRDHASRNGVLLGENRIRDREVVWRSPLMARIGQSVLALEEPVGLALAELEAAPDAKLPEAGAPPPPTSAEPARAPEEAAPIAEDPRERTTYVKPKRKKRAWTAADIAVVTIAVLVISVSLAGLVWVLR